MITSSRKFLDVQKIIIGKQRKWSKLKAAKKERKYNKREKKRKPVISPHSKLDQNSLFS